MGQEEPPECEDDESDSVWGQRKKTSQERAVISVDCYWSRPGNVRMEQSVCCI